MTNLITRDVATEVRIVASAGQTSFSCSFPIFAAIDLLVTVNGVVTAPASISGIGDPAGITVTLSARAAGDIVVLARATKLKRTVDLPATGPYSSEDIDREFDRAFAALQQLSTKVNRSLRFGTGEAIGDLPFASRLNRLLYFDGAGVARFVGPAEIPEFIGPAGSLEVSGLEFVTPFQFMTQAERDARIPGTTDDAPFFRRAIDYIISKAQNPAGNVVRGGMTLHVPPGTYRFGTTLEIKGVTFIMKGANTGKSARATLIYVAANTPGIIVHDHDTIGLQGETPSTFGASGMTIDGIALQSDGGNMGAADADGIRLRARASIVNCNINGFPGHGIHAIASENSTDFEGNVNSLYIVNNACESNGLSGIRLAGSDANAGVIMGNDCAYNGRWGIQENSFLGNCITGNHTNANGVKGFGGNSVASSIVHISDGRRFFVMPGQAAAASTTTPGTNASVWGLYADAIPLANMPTGHPLWESGVAYFEGGPLQIIDANCVSFVAGNYSEGSQGPVQTNGRSIIIGNFFNETPVITRLGGRPFAITNHENAVSSPGGFYVQSGDITVSYGKDGKLMSWTTGATPAGHVWERNNNDIRLSYGGADANEVMRVTGPNHTGPAGIHALLTYKLAIGIGPDVIKIRSRPGAPAAGEFPNNTYVFNSNIASGAPKGWFVKNDGVIVADALIP